MEVENLLLTDNYEGKYDEISLLEGEKVLTGCYFIDDDGEHYRELGDGFGAVKVMNFDNFSQYWYGIIKDKSRFITHQLFAKLGYYDADEGLICVCNGGQDEFLSWGFVNTRGDVVIPFNHRCPLMFTDDDPYVLTLYREHPLGGDQYFSYKPHYFRDGLIVMGKECAGHFQWGVYDNGGNIIIPFGLHEYIDREFSSDRILVRNQGTYGYVNYRGQEVIRCQYNWATGFFKCKGKSWAIASYDKYREFIIDMDGNQISEVYYGISKPDKAGMMKATTLDAFRDVKINPLGEEIAY